MTQLHINGVESMEGEVEIQGSKNAVLPILAATMLTEGQVKIYHCPRILDVYHMIEILQYMNCQVEWEGEMLCINTSGAVFRHLPESLLGKCRASILFLGSVLGRFHKAVIAYPGGCQIGQRPIDFHIEGLMKMHAQISEEEEQLYALGGNLKGAKIRLKFPSVGATQNLMLAAVLAKGDTKIKNCAKEPEIIYLQNFLNTLGADIRGAGTSEIQIHGVEKLHSGEYVLPGDRIVAGTYLIAGAATGGEVCIKGIEVAEVEALNYVLTKMGCRIYYGADTIVLQRKNRERLQALPRLATKPYPGFPTDMQSQILVAMSMANGKSQLKETIFEARFQVVSELEKMGADILVSDNRANVNGVSCLHGAKVAAKDLRGGAALAIAGVLAKGKTQLSGYEYIHRGYEDIVGDLNRLGADIRLEE